LIGKVWRETPELTSEGVVYWVVILHGDEGTVRACLAFSIRKRGVHYHHIEEN